MQISMIFLNNPSSWISGCATNSTRGIHCRMKTQESLGDLETIVSVNKFASKIHYCKSMEKLLAQLQFPVLFVDPMM